MTINELKVICINDSIPILRDKTLEYIINIIKENKIKSILEIGTAYGYSSFAFNQIDCVDEILSIEKNKDNYLKAKNFLAGNKKINLVNDDCFNFVPNKKYDLIFIDGPKSRQDQLFLKYSSYLEDNGFYEKMTLPDGSDAWSDYGIRPLEEIILEYNILSPITSTRSSS